MGGSNYLAIALFWVAFSSPLQAETDIFDLNAAERQVLGQAIRDVLIATPELLRGDGPSMAMAYDAEVESDQILIQQQHTKLFDKSLTGFGPDAARMKLAFFTASSCETCPQAEEVLKRLANTHDLRVYVIDAAKEPDLAKKMGIDTLPFYILPRMMLRGAIPDAVLDRYLTNGTGQ